MGADAAELAGERAALALLQDRGIAIDEAHAASLERQLQQIGKFRLGLEQAFPFPQQWAHNAADELVVCRCEQITAGQLRQAAHELGACEMNRLKALTRVGMGRCQGRMCGLAAAEILAQASAVPLAQVGRLRGQAPIKPLPLDMHVVDGTDAVDASEVHS
jgi:bacterioferritin-associated ferredoxin